MRICLTLLAAGLRVALRAGSNLLVVMGFAAFFVGVAVALIGVLALAPEARAAIPDRERLARYLALAVYSGGFLAMGLYVNVFSASFLAREKARRLHETLLAEPVSVRELWIAKGLTLFLPGLAACAIFSVLALAGARAFLPPGVLPAPAAADFLPALLAPLVQLPLCLLVSLVALSGSPVAGNVVANIAFSAGITLAMNLVTRAGMDPASPAFALGHAAVALALALAVLALSPRLTRERVVLSAGG